MWLIHMWPQPYWLTEFTSLKYPTPSFNISNYVTFNNSNTRSSNIKLHHKILSNSICANSYFYRLPRLWNSLPVIDLTLSFNTIKQQLTRAIYGNIFKVILIQIINVLSISHVLVVIVQSSPNPCNYHLL